ncbi:MAG: hypothetical protein Q9228_008050, partial [Teloschistes exilis]
LISPRKSASMNSPMRIIDLSRLGAMVAVACLGVFVAGCQKKPEAKPALTGQEVGQVGSEPITTSELQLEIKPSNLKQALSDQDKAAALLQIAARKSLAQRAVAEGLDRQPVILLQIRRAREQILAEAAAAESARSDEKKLSLDRINSFIAAHPNQFGKRAILQTHEVLISATGDVNKIVQDVKDANKLEQVQTYLDTNKIATQQKNVELDTGTLPDALVTALEKGNSIPVIKAPPLTIFMQVTQTKPAPITGSNAETLARNVMLREAYQSQLAAPGPGDG